MDQFYTLGEPLSGPEALTAPLAHQGWKACRDDPRFTVLELRRIEADRSGDVVVVDCKNDRVPTKASRGIRYIERLALVFPMDPAQPPEVRALRKDFPATEHQNSVLPGQASWLCLYFEPWVAVVRSWTAHRFLERIIVWLGDVAAGELHRADQPLEQFYFTAPWELVLPATVRQRGVPENQVLAVQAASPKGARKGLFVATLQARNTPVNGVPLSALVIETPPVVHGKIEAPPHTIGALAEQLLCRGSDLLKPLVAGLHQLTESTGIRQAENEMGLLVVRLPLKRHAESDVQSYQLTAFAIEKGLGAVGAALGVLRADPEKQRYFRVLAIGGAEPVYSEAWKGLVVEQVAVLEALDSRLAHRVTDVAPATASFAGALIGAGSLGSALGDVWAREAWGRWTVLDEDLLKPHNVPRHRGYRLDVGLHKADAVARRMALASPEDHLAPVAVTKDALAQDDDVLAALKGAGLIVDASTTLHVPRTLASRDLSARCASVFFTPSGQSAVMLLEDADRQIRLDALEAQYYRGILRAEWGARHLVGHRSREYWIGAGCREVTTVLSPEMVSQLGGLLARRLRRSREEQTAAIAVWEHDDSVGSVAAHWVPVAPVLHVQALLWEVRWDEEVRAKVRELRAESLPAETGGVLVGYVDMVSRVIQIVDAMPPPPDSVPSPDSFERGETGVAGEVARIGHRTAGVVGYVGEWHSHPDGVAAEPSRADYSQLLFLTDHLRNEGLPALILIVGDKSERFAVGDALD